MVALPKVMACRGVVWHQQQEVFPGESWWMQGWKNLAGKLNCLQHRGEGQDLCLAGVALVQVRESSWASCAFVDGGGREHPSLPKNNSVETAARGLLSLLKLWDKGSNSNLTLKWDSSRTVGVGLIKWCCIIHCWFLSHHLNIKKAIRGSGQES